MDGRSQKHLLWGDCRWVDYIYVCGGDNDNYSNLEERMIKCNGYCDSLICDFCKFYNFNGRDGVYVNRGWCKLLHKRKAPGDGCKRFHCFRAEK